MRRLCSNKQIAIALFMIFFVSASLLQAQFPASPLQYLPLHDEDTKSLNIDYGFGEKNETDLSYVGLRGTLESEAQRGSIGFGLIIPENGNKNISISASYSKNLRDNSEALYLFSAQIGIGYFKFDTKAGLDVKQLDLPLGLAAGLNGAYLPFDLSGVILWLAPRIHFRYSKLSVLNTESSGWRGGGGVTIGVNLFFLEYFGALVSLDLLRIRDISAANWRNESVIRLGLSYWR